MQISLGSLVVLSALALAGCGKVQSLLGKGDAGASGESGGLFGSLKSDDGLGFLSGFEGQIDVAAKGKMNGGSARPGAAPESINLSILVKDKRFRVDLPASVGSTALPFKGYGVLDGTQKKAILVTDAPEKMAVVFDLNKTGEQLKSYAPSARSARTGAPAKESKPPKVTKTGRKDKVAGYVCEDWEIEGDDGKATLCVAKQGFSWLQIPLLGAPAEYAWAGELLDGSHLPLRAIVTEKDGKESGRVEITKIEKKALAANLFEIPAGYPQLTVEQMIQKMMGGMGGMGGRTPGGRTPGGLPPGAMPPGFGTGVPGGVPPRTPPPVPPKKAGSSL